MASRFRRLLPGTACRTEHRHCWTNCSDELHRSERSVVITAKPRIAREMYSATYETERTAFGDPASMVHPKRAAVTAKWNCDPKGQNALAEDRIHLHPGAGRDHPLPGLQQKCKRRRGIGCCCESRKCIRHRGTKNGEHTEFQNAVEQVCKKYAQKHEKEGEQPGGSSARTVQPILSEPTEQYQGAATKQDQVKRLA